MDKTTTNVHLEMRNLKQTEEQRKERLRIRHEKNRARRRTKQLQEEKKRSSATEDHEKQRLATLKRLKRGDENELERKLRLENVVARNSSGWPWRQKKKEGQGWIPNGSVWPWSKTEEDSRLIPTLFSFFFLSVFHSIFFPLLLLFPFVLLTSPFFFLFSLLFSFFSSYFPPQHFFPSFFFYLPPFYLVCPTNHLKCLATFEHGRTFIVLALRKLI